MPSDKPMIELAREFRERVRDDYVLEAIGSGLNTQAIYDEPAIAAAFATQQVEECAKIADNAGCNLVAAAIRSRKESR